MEKLEVQKKVLNLGKLFVKELGLETSVDTLGRWLAHYLAEKIDAAESAVGEEKTKLEKECFEIILKIWDHRWKMKHENRPYENFAKLFEYLVKLNPEKEESFYYRVPISEKEIIIKESSKSEEWLNAAAEIDKYARINIDYSLTKAAKSLKTKEVSEWLQNAPNLAKDFDTQVIRFILREDNDYSNTDDEESNEKLMKKFRVQKIKDNIEFLENITKINSKILKELKQDLTRFIREEK